jgi:carbon monoxide dehydrogenase subunit G
MLKLESKIGIVNRNVSEIYTLLSNFENLRNYIPREGIENIEIENDKCIFSVQGQKIEICILNKEENNFIKFGSSKNSPFEFYFWIQVKPINENSSKIKLTLHIDIPLLLQPFVKGKLEKALDEIVDKLSGI